MQERGLLKKNLPVSAMYNLHIWPGTKTIKKNYPIGPNQPQPKIQIMFYKKPTAGLF